MKNNLQQTINKEFLDACKAGDLNQVKYLLTSPELKIHADIHAKKDLGFQVACGNGHLEVVKYLCSAELRESGIEYPRMNGYSDYALTFACERGQFQVVKYLLTFPKLEKHAHLHVKEDIEFSNLDSAFHNACKSGNLEIVRYLLTSPELVGHAYIHSAKGFGYRGACANGHLEVVKYLLSSPELVEKGIGFANVIAENSDNSGYEMACENGHLEVVKYLLETPEIIPSGRTLEDVCGVQYYGLPSASKLGQLAVVEYLIMEKRIPLSDSLIQYLNSPNNNITDNEQVLKLFNTRNLYSSFNEKLSSPKMVSNKLAVTKNKNPKV